jgi:hypothetical protein
MWNILHCNKQLPLNRQKEELKSFPSTLQDDEVNEIKFDQI